MVETARAKGFHPKDNNQADALAILALAQHIEGLTVPEREAV
jgi:hypothetical protein